MKFKTRRQRYAAQQGPNWALLGLLGVFGLVAVFAIGWSLGRRQAPQRVKIETVPAVNHQPAHVNAAAQRELTQQFQAANFSGTAIIIQKGRLVAQYSHGFANVSTKQGNGLKTMYEIDSVQKSLTAGILAQQLNANKVQFTTPLAHFYPRFKPEPQLTVAHALHMTSGLSTKATLPGKTDQAVLAANLRKLTYQPKNFGKFQYTPVNYVLLAGISEKLTHRSYRQLFTRTYIKPLGLKQTRFADALGQTPLAAQGYYAKDYHKKQLTVAKPNRDLIRGELGTGQVFMSVLDLYHAEQALVNGKITGASRDLLYVKKGVYSGGFYVKQPYYQANGTGYGYNGSIAISHNGQNAVLYLSNVQTNNRNQLLTAERKLMVKYGQ